MPRPALLLALACLLALVCSWPILAPEPQAPDTFAPVAFQCWTGPRVYCAPDLSRCWETCASKQMRHSAPACYAVSDPWEHLSGHGHVIFQAAPES